MGESEQHANPTAIPAADELGAHALIGMTPVEFESHITAAFNAAVDGVFATLSDRISIDDHSAFCLATYEAGKRVATAMIAESARPAIAYDRVYLLDAALHKIRDDALQSLETTADTPQEDLAPDPNAPAAAFIEAHTEARNTADDAREALREFITALRALQYAQAQLDDIPISDRATAAVADEMEDATAFKVGGLTVDQWAALLNGTDVVTHFGALKTQDDAL